MKKVEIHNKILGVLDSNLKDVCDCCYVIPHDETDIVAEQLTELVMNDFILENVISYDLNTEVFKLANKLALAGHGDEAVKLQKIHNSLR